MKRVPKPHPHNPASGFSTKPRIVINKDGSLNVHKPHNPEALFFDLYHYLLSFSWPKFFIVVITLFIVVNLFFASIYFMLGPGAIRGIDEPDNVKRFIECFFFSVHNLNSGFHPATLLANILVTIEVYLMMLILAIITGLFYARFARPRARILFSNNALITRHNGRACMIFRAANERLNQIVEAHMTLTYTRNEISKEGESSRKFYNLKLEYDYSPLFALTWTLRHYIDASSPLFGKTAKDLEEEQAVIFASLNGIDDTFSQTITARNVYRYDEITYDARFKDILLWRDNKVYINLKGIHNTEPLQKIHQ